MLDMKTIRDAVAEYFKVQQEWRAMKAEQYPYDDRDARSAEWLEELVEDITTLRDDDPLLRRIGSMDVALSLDADMSTLPKRLNEFRLTAADRLAGRYGFDRYLTPREFLSRWIDMLEDDCVAYMKQ